MVLRSAQRGLGALDRGLWLGFSVRVYKQLRTLPEVCCRWSCAARSAASARSTAACAASRVVSDTLCAVTPIRPATCITMHILIIKSGCLGFVCAEHHWCGCNSVHRHDMSA